MKKLTLAALAVAVLLGAAGLAAEPGTTPSAVAPPAAKPMVTIALSGYDELLKDAEFLGTLSGNPQLKQTVDEAVQNSPAGAVLAGIDTSRPWGFVVQAGAEQLPMFGFVPVTDVEKILAALEPSIGKPADAGSGVLEINVQGQTLYLKEQEGGWLFMARSPDILSATPADPIQALEGLHERYDLGIRVSVANVPPMLRQMAMGFMQMGLQAGMERLPEETDEERARRGKMAQQGLDEVQRALNEIDTLLLGFAVDRTASVAFFENVVTAVKGTETAERMALSAEAPSEFAGFARPDAAFTLDAVSKISPQDIEATKTYLATVRTNATRELKRWGLSSDALERAKKLSDELFDLLGAMIERGSIDLGMSLSLDPDAVNYVSGFQVGDSAKLDTFIRDFAAELTRQEPGMAEAIKLDAAEHEGVRFHLLSLPTAEMAEKFPNLPKMVGETLDVVIGIGPENGYVAAGRNALETLKKAIDQSKAQAAQPVLPLRMTLAATAIAKFAAIVARDDSAKQTATQVAAMLEEAGQKDHLTVTYTPIPDGMKGRLELEEGLLKVLAAAPLLMGGPK